MNNEELIIDLIAHPERYSDQQMQEILSDDETLAAYTALLEARMAIDKGSAEKVDIDAAWRNFAAQNAALLEQHQNGELPSDAALPKHYPNGELTSDASPRPQSFQLFLTKWRKIAAMFVAAVAVSGLTFAAIHTFTADRQTQKSKVETVQKADADANAADTARTVTGKDMAHAEKKPIYHKTFENVTLGNMLEEMARYYGMTVDFRNDAARSLRYYYEWDSANDINTVIDELNHSEQVAIAIEGNKIVVE